MKKVIKQCNHVWILSYFIIYVIWFFYLNQKSIDSFHPIESVVDQYIPFVEAFIIPYYLWFLYVPLTIGYFFFTSREEYYRLCMFLFIGMTICLIVYSVYPTGVYFRPNLDELGRSNLLIEMTRFIYYVDVGTNVCPSIHCFNAIGVAIALLRCNRCKQRKWIGAGAILLSILICMSTVFVKQHSITDFYYAIGLALLMYVVAYIPKYDNLFTKMRTLPEVMEVVKEHYLLIS